MKLKSNEPFWLVKNGLVSSFPSLREDQECEVLIIGGGITGSLIAHQCIADGLSTILIDKREISNGSSSATTSMLQYEIDTPLYKLIEMIGKKPAIDAYNACFEAIDQLGEIAKSIQSKAGFTSKKSLYFAAYKKDVSWLKKEFEARKDAGFKVKWMDAEMIFDTFGIQNTFGGILSDQGASVDAFMLVHEVLNYNLKKGLKVFDKTELIKVKPRKGFNECVLNTGATIKAKRIVYCVGYESQSMIKENFVNLISTYAIVSEINDNPPKSLDKLLVWNTADPYIYLRTTEDNRILIGGEDEEFQDTIKRDELIDKKEKKLLKSFEKMFPEQEFISDFTWAGTFGVTKDGLPYIGEHKDFKNAYFVLGFGGNGITFSVAGMAMVSDWIKGKKNKLTPLFAFGR